MLYHHLHTNEYIQRIGFALVIHSLRCADDIHHHSVNNLSTLITSEHNVHDEKDKWFTTTPSYSSSDWNNKHVVSRSVYINGVYLCIGFALVQHSLQCTDAIHQTNYSIWQIDLFINYRCLIKTKTLKIDHPKWLSLMTRVPKVPPWPRRNGTDS